MRSADSVRRPAIVGDNFLLEFLVYMAQRSDDERARYTHEQHVERLVRSLRDKVAHQLDPMDTHEQRVKRVERILRDKVAHQLDRFLTGRLLYDDPEEVIEKVSTIVVERLRSLSYVIGNEGKYLRDMSWIVDLDEMEKGVAKSRRERLDMNEEKNLRDVISRIVDLDEMEKGVAKSRRERIDMNDALGIESSDREVNKAFEMLKIFKSDIVHQVAKKLISSDPIFLDRAQVEVANRLDRLTGRLLMLEEHNGLDVLTGRSLMLEEPREVLIEEISSIVAEEVGNSFKEVHQNKEFLSYMISQFVDLDQMEKHVAMIRWEEIETADAVRIESSDREVNIAFGRLKSFKSDIVHQVAKRLKVSGVLACSYDTKKRCEDDRLNSNPLRLRYDRKEIGRTLRLIELTLKERETDKFTKNLAGYLKLKKFRDYFLKLIEQWNDKAQEKRMESSDERSKPESKGMVFKRNTLRKQHNSDRDDPGELFPDLVELETVLEDCVMDLPQLVSFIIIYGLLDLEDLTVNDTNMNEKMLMISNQGCGEEHELSVVVGNTPIIVV